jgi:hypothetical protein
MDKNRDWIVVYVDTETAELCITEPVAPFLLDAVTETGLDPRQIVSIHVVNTGDTVG